MTLSSNVRVLFVDDEPNFLAGIRRMLRSESAQWDLHFAESADAALEKAQDIPFDAIVSDVTMPGKDGLELLRLLKSEAGTREIPVVILTGNAESDLKRRALDLGATDLLNKPVTREDLIARLRSAVRLKSYQDELRRHNEMLEIRVRERTLELEFSRRDIIWRLAKAGEFRDADTGYHVARVALCSKILAERLGLPPADIDTLFLTSPLHDIGKIGIPDGILHKKGNLTPEERGIIEKHCEIGASILLDLPKGAAHFLGLQTSQSETMAAEITEPLREAAAQIAMTHHERWDGSGYPKGLKGERIPIAGRIVAVADLYDALRSARSYKPSYEQAEAMRVLRESAGSHIDPGIFEVFEQVSDEFERTRRQHFS